ncbi:protein S100-A8-like [Cygnus olor]|uniref:protein S100-A8-like n=1 Tax=Cygnus olor TaxID=8869 RepID=UPI0006717297|nr:protein S100-A8-like [Cygnus olor]XP_040395110.1 protein S100-A8-like [Cygnus olor]
MSASTATTLPGHRQFPGNCTLEMALNAIVDVYHRYSIRKGELDLLNFNEFNTLLKEQAPTFLEACNRNRSGYLQELFKETDLNKDKELSFEEFTIVLSKVADDAHRIMHGENRCKPESN